MHRIFIAGIISASIAITALSTGSATAADRGTTNFLAGLAGLAILGAIIHDSKKKKAREHTSRDTYVPHQNEYEHGGRAGRHDHGYNAHSRHKGKHHHQPKARKLPHRVSRKVLPGKCLRRLDTRHGQRRILGGRCLDNNFRHVNSLPGSCYREVRSRGRLHHGYGARCLRNKGYSIARH